jgi:hypothetical protein
MGMAGIVKPADRSSLAMRIPAWPGVLFSEQPHDQGDNEADYDHGGYGDIDSDIWPVNHDIPGQTP